MSICIVFNPAARGEKADRFRKLLEEMRGAWVLKPTTGPGAARSLTAQAVNEGFHTIVAAGGDGTLNEVLNGIGDVPDGFDRTRLGVLPLGTINVFAREIRLPLNLRKVWPVLLRGNEARIDLGCAEFQGAQGPERRYFVQLAGAGFDARTIEMVSWDLKKKLGGAAYALAGFQALGVPHADVTISNGTETASGQLILIGNGKFYGGNFPVFHKGDLQDGVLDAVVLKKVNWLAFPGHLWDFLSGRFFKEGGSAYLTGKQFELRAEARGNGQPKFQVEGELVGELPATISVRPKALRIIVP